MAVKPEKVTKIAKKSIHFNVVPRKISSNTDKKILTGSRTLTEIAMTQCSVRNFFGDYAYVDISSSSLQFEILLSEHHHDCFTLSKGVMFYVMIEMGVWIFLSYAAIDNESEFFHNYDLYKFEEHIEDNWYYQMMFGLPEEEDYDYENGFESAADDSDGIDIEYRYQNITINGIMMLIFIAYFIVSFFFLIGIAKKNTNFFIPYLAFDFYIIWMSFIMIIGGLFMLNFILIRNCSIFASIKIYPAICNYSLFKKMNGKFKFTRDVPSLVIGPSIDFESRRRSSETKQKRRKGEANNFELEALHSVKVQNDYETNNVISSAKKVEKR